VAEQPQARYKDKQVDKGKGMEDDGEWLMIDLCNDNHMFFFPLPTPRRYIANRTEPYYSGLTLVYSSHLISRSFHSNSDFQFPSFYFNITDPSLPFLASNLLLFPPTIVNRHLQHWASICLLSTITKLISFMSPFYRLMILNRRTNIQQENHLIPSGGSPWLIERRRPG
jgi:hypothetical protein